MLWEGNVKRLYINVLLKTRGRERHAFVLAPKVCVCNKEPKGMLSVYTVQKYLGICSLFIVNCSLENMFNIHVIY